MTKASKSFSLVQTTKDTWCKEGNYKMPSVFKKKKGGGEAKRKEQSSTAVIFKP